MIMHHCLCGILRADNALGVVGGRTALIPTVTPVARTGSRQGKGDVRLVAEASGVDPAFTVDEYDFVTEVNSAGVYIPDIELAAAGYVGVSEHVELGVQMLCTNDEWSTPNTVGVLPFPEWQQPKLLIGRLCRVSRIPPL